MRLFGSDRNAMRRIAFSESFYLKSVIIIKMTTDCFCPAKRGGASISAGVPDETGTNIKTTHVKLGF